ncbi:MAG: signal peptidase I, partial [Sandaracinobacteroides sp.]
LAAQAVRPGDVIAFVGADGTDYVKRMVAAGGDLVELRNGLLFVNQLPAPCVPVDAARCRETLPNGSSHIVRNNGSGRLADFPPTRVPDGHYFVLGDNRDASADSRVPRAEGGVGPVEDGHVIGRAARIFFSKDVRGVRWDRIGMPIG